MMLRHLKLISLILLFISFQSSLNSSGKEYYENLVSNWSKIFPDQNRNAAGPKFFKFIIDQNMNYDEFVEYNKLYCAVSGSLISPGSMPEFLYVNQEKSDKKICGYYYRCCIPCSCDIMKYSKVQKINHQFRDVKKDIFVLTIDNPCKKDDFPKRVNKDYFCKNDKLDTNQVFEIDGKLVIGLLHKAKPCNEQNINYIKKNEVTGEYCDIRNNTPTESLQSGMGDIFIKLAR